MIKRHNVLKFVAICALCSYVTLILVEQRERVQRDRSIEEYLNSDDLDLYDLERELLTLSLISDGLNERASRHPEKREYYSDLSRKAVELVLNSGEFAFSNRRIWEDQGLFLSHLNIILGSYHAISNDTSYLCLNREISEFLVNQLRNAPFYTIRSYGSMNNRWSADNSATLYSLFLFDKNNGTNRSKAIISEWLNVIKNEGTDVIAGLPVSEITGCETYSSTPRGCGLSFSVYYMSRFAPDEAKELWHNYKSKMKKSYVVVAGFREYPKGRELGEDYDTGPIILDVGASATGLGLIASASMDDWLTTAQIDNALRIIDIGIMISGDEYLHQERHSSTAEGILFLRDSYR